MFKCSILLWMTFAIGLGGTARAADATPVAAGCFGDRVRISALVNLGGKSKVGIVDIATSNSYMLAAGGRAGDIEVVSIDYDREEVTLKRGDMSCVLRLAADPHAPRGPVLSPQEAPFYRGEAIERFLRENPNAIEKGLVKLPLTPPPPVEGRGETIERFLRENPEAARIANTPAVGKGEGIERFLREHPEIKVDDTPIPEGSLGPGIEAALRQQPAMATNRLSAPPAPANP